MYVDLVHGLAREAEKKKHQKEEKAKEELEQEKGRSRRIKRDRGEQKQRVPGEAI